MPGPTWFGYARSLSFLFGLKACFALAFSLLSCSFPDQSEPPWATFFLPFRSFPDQSEWQLFPLLSVPFLTKAKGNFFPSFPSHQNRRVVFQQSRQSLLCFFFNSVRQVSQRFSEEKLRLAFYSVKTSRETTTECH